MPWKTRGHLEDHYKAHREEFPGASLEEYEASSEQTLDLGVFFSFTHWRTGEERTGCYHAPTRRLTILDDADWIVSHFHCPESYVIGLDDSTYG